MDGCILIEQAGEEVADVDPYDPARLKAFREDGTPEGENG